MEPLVVKDEYVSTEHLLIAIAQEKGGATARILAAAGVTPEAIYRSLVEVRGSQRVTDPNPEDKYQALHCGTGMVLLASRPVRVLTQYPALAVLHLKDNAVLQQHFHDLELPGAGMFQRYGEQLRLSLGAKTQDVLKVAERYDRGSPQRAGV